MILYHGSGERVEQLTPTRDVVGGLDYVLWLAPDREVADQYAQDDAEDGEGCVYEVALRSDVRLIDEDYHTDDVHQEDIDRWKNEGYQGAHVLDYDSQERRHPSVVVWDESAIERVRSVTRNCNPSKLKAKLLR
jgi:hypothetical protein